MNRNHSSQGPLLLVAAGLFMGSVAIATALVNQPRMGRQPDGSFVVSTGQRLEADGRAFAGRPSDLAVHPSGEFYAVMGRNRVFIGDATKVHESAGVSLGSNAGFHGLVWSSDGKMLYASTQKGNIQSFTLADDKKSVVANRSIRIVPETEKENPVPGGLALTKNGKTLYAVSANRNSVVEVDLSADPAKILREIPVESVPFDVKLSEDESLLVASNWAGPLPKAGDRIGKSDKQDVVVNERQG
ncbi:MAG: hypothetical protein ACKO5E_14745, partial [bacterium]